MKWEKIHIQNDSGSIVEAIAPIIISASRATDIPAFYSKWFFNRLQKGYVIWKNPFNGKNLYVSFKNTRLIVFWSKNPYPLLDHVNELKERNINFYIQFTMNDYEKENIEPHIPPLSTRIDTFKKLSDKIGKEKIIWRFDPLLLTDELTVEELLYRTKLLGDTLQGYTEKMVFSYVDISNYKKVKSNLSNTRLTCREFSPEEMNQYASSLTEYNKQWHYSLATCAEQIDFSSLNIVHNKCIDDDLMIRLFHQDQKLMEFLGIKFQHTNDLFLPPVAIKTSNMKDKGQRKLCGCIISKDIGTYNTCPHLCEYCYANAGKETVVENWKQIKNKPTIENLIK